MFFPNRDALQQNRLLKEHRRVAKIKAMPPLDIQKIASARQQEKDDNVPFRFGEGFDTHITLDDGEWTDRESGRLWTMAIESKRAYSIKWEFFPRRAKSLRSVSETTGKIEREMLMREEIGRAHV